MRFKDFAYNLPNSVVIFCAVVLLGVLFSCHDPKAQIPIGQKQIVETPREINTRAEDVIESTLSYLLQRGGNLGDSIYVKYPQLVRNLYAAHHYTPFWSQEGHFSTATDSLLSFIDSSRNYGLFPEDYYQSKLRTIVNNLAQDTSKEVKLDASKWAYSDLLLTSVFVQMTKDLKYGRIIADSTFQADSSFNANYLNTQITRFQQMGVDSLVQPLEPANPNFAKLISAIPRFLSKADMRKFSYVDKKDSLQWPQLVIDRIHEEDSLITVPEPDSLYMPDSLVVARVIKSYQKWKKWHVDGKLTPDLVNRLNDNDHERFIRIAISLDKYKMDPPLPKKYVWVNLPSFYMEVRDSDSVVIRSKIIVGKPTTRTPTLTSMITNMVTYPQWHIPESIIKKEILPGLKRDPSYTKRKGYSLVDDAGNEINPLTVNWSKYKDYIPYNVVQGSGDDNALGVLKFNFPNKYSVYLHDTNQRYLFGKTNRALSHGCVRVQAWKELANYILRNDSAIVTMDTVRISVTPVDSLNSWLARKEKRVIPVHERIPLFIRYITCDVKGDRIAFYEDIYGEDRKIREKVFAGK